MTCTYCAHPRAVHLFDQCWTQRHGVNGDSDCTCTTYTQD